MLTTDRTRIEPLAPVHAELLHAYLCENREHLARWEPSRDEDYYEEDTSLILTEIAWQERAEGNSQRFAILTPQRDELIALCNFTCILRGSFQACYLGYSIARKYEGRGYMQEALQTCIDYMFREQKLHRIMANHMPNNRRSAALLQRLGFVVEGEARAYLKIAGRWEDHVLTALVNPLTA